MKYVVDYKIKMTNNAAVKPRTDIIHILKKQGWNSIYMYDLHKNTILRHVDLVIKIIKLFRLKKDDIVLLQWPFQLLFPFRNVEVENLMKCKKVLLIHDVESLRKQENDYPEISNFNKYDLIVTHTENFKSWLISNGVIKPILVIQIFDYVLKDREFIFHLADITKYRVVFSGNLSKVKSGFLYSNIKPVNYTLELYGNGYTLENTSSVHHNGSYEPDEVVYRIEGDFGLVWDGNSIETCSGSYGNYLKYNCPYKLSMYIAAGLPVIIWSGAAMADFVNESGIGFVVNSLNEIDKKLLCLDKGIYNDMVNNVQIIRKDIIRGKYTLKIINEVVRLLR